MTSSGESSSGAVAMVGRALHQFLVHAAGEFQIFPRLALIRRRTQQVSGMISHYQRSVELAEIMHPAAQSSEWRVGREQILRRDPSDREHDFRPQQGNLSQQV